MKILILGRTLSNTNSLLVHRHGSTQQQLLKLHSSRDSSLSQTRSQRKGQRSRERTYDWGRSLRFLTGVGRGVSVLLVTGGSMMDSSHSDLVLCNKLLFQQQIKTLKLISFGNLIFEGGSIIKHTHYNRFNVKVLQKLWECCGMWLNHFQSTCLVNIKQQFSPGTI